MDPHDRAVDHLHLAAMRLGDYVHRPVPDPSLAPAIEAIVGRRIWPIALGDSAVTIVAVMLHHPRVRAKRRS